MSRTAPASAPRPTPDAGTARGGRGPLERVTLTAGVAVTAVAALALVALLAVYFAGGTVPSALILLVYGLPVGFGLLILHVVLAAVRRSRA